MRCQFVFKSIVWCVVAVLVFPASLYAGISVENGLTHEFEVNPGNSYGGEIEIANYGDHDQYVKIYQKDFLFNENGESFYLEPGSVKRSNAHWIDIDASYIKIPAQRTIIVKYEIKVPDDTLTGSYWSLIMVEGVNNIDTGMLSKGVNVNTVIRYGIQIITSIGNTGSRKLKFLSTELIKEDTVRYLKVDIQNLGERYLRPVLKLELFDNEGKSIGVFQSGRRKIYPGTSVRMKIILTDVAPGKYQALLIADSDEDEVFGVNITLEIKDG